jgi:hypothetical protein
MHTRRGPPLLSIERLKLKMTFLHLPGLLQTSFALNLVASIRLMFAYVRTHTYIDTSNDLNFAKDSRSYSLRFKIKVTFGHKLRYKIKVTFGEISLKLRQTNWNVARNNVNVVVDELPSHLTVNTCLTIDIWTRRR